jgi:hypothetical protein
MSMLSVLAAEPLKQATRAATVAATPGTWPLLGAAAAWNTWWDKKYYDLPALTEDELAQLKGSLLAQGTVLIVQPGRGPNRIETMSGDKFIDAQKNGTSPIKALVLPGVGGTSLAAAALARNAADALREPVAAIVPGYGSIDLFADMWGGWYVLGVNNRLLDLADQVEALGYQSSGAFTGTQGDATANFVFNTGSDWPSPMALLLNETSEVNMLKDLFSGANNLKLLVGHSKGCLSFAFALNAVVRSGSAKLRSDLHVVTIGCVTHFPEEVKKSQFLGTEDRLGRMNSRPRVPRVSLLGKKHSLNSEFPTSVNVAEVLRLAEVARA